MKMPPGTAFPDIAEIAVLDSATQLTDEHKGKVVVVGSHGGIYPAYLAARWGVRGIILNDAGVGLEEAGIGSLRYLEAIGVPAAAVSHSSARIGSGEDMVRRGIISHVNGLAAHLNCVAGQNCQDAIFALSKSDTHITSVPAYSESRVLLRPGTVPVWGIDSASLVEPGDAGAIVIAGSHGGLVGGRPETALRVQALAAVYHDAGIGVERAGVSRLPVLDARGIVAAAVDYDSARIGEARSLWETGRLSVVNNLAASLGVLPGISVKEFADVVIARYQARVSNLKSS